MKIRVLNGCLTSVLAAVSLQAIYAQVLSCDDGTRSIPMAHVRSLLRQPGGIEKIANIIGNFSLNDPTERWGESNLLSLSRSSTLIVRGVLKKTVSMLSPDGDSIDTVYTLEVRRVFKGDASGPISIRCSGGRLVLPDGHTVTVHTPESDNLHIGEDYFVFLKSQDGTLGLADGIQGLFRVTPEGTEFSFLILTRAVPLSCATSKVRGLQPLNKKSVT